MLCKARMCLGSLPHHAFANCCRQCRTKRCGAGIIFPRQSFCSVSVLVCFGFNHSRDPVLQLSRASAAVARVVGLWQMLPLGWGRFLQHSRSYLAMQSAIPSGMAPCGVGLHEPLPGADLILCWWQTRCFLEQPARTISLVGNV